VIRAPVPHGPMPCFRNCLLIEVVVKSRFVIFLVLLAALPFIVGCSSEKRSSASAIVAPAVSPTPAVSRLIDDGAKLNGLANYSTLSLTPNDIQQLKAYCHAHPDPSAFVALMVLRDRSRTDYQSLHPASRSAILCRALRHLLTLADFGHLPKTLDPRAQNGESAMHALLEADRDENLKLLFQELEDRVPVDFFGSSDSTAAIRDRYRHCDYAEWACRLILGEPYSLKDAVSERDAAIAALKSRLLREGLVKSPTPLGL
jgi:hypothetical protein